MLGWYRIRAEGGRLKLLDTWYVLFWAVLAALALAGEVLTVSFFLVFFSFGAVVALVLSVLGLGAALQIGGFVAASVAGMLVLRPALVSRLSFKNSERYVGRGDITGKSAVVTQAIWPEESGMIRIGGGDFWTARALYSGGEIEEGTRVRVLDTDGVTALVEPQELSPGESGEKGV